VGTQSKEFTGNATYTAQSDSYTHHEPRPHAKTRSRYKWTTATGMFWAWQDQIISVSTNPFGFIGSALPSV
jgi:hypothetical protein